MWRQNDANKKARKEEKRMRKFSLRLTDEELEEVDLRARELGISKNDYIRRQLSKDQATIDDVLAELQELRKLIAKK